MCKEKDIENIKMDPFRKVNQLWGINTTTCGHMMHAECWEK